MTRDLRIGALAAVGGTGYLLLTALRHVTDSAWIDVARLVAAGIPFLAQAALENAPRENAHEPAVVRHRHPLEVVLFKEAVRVVDVHVRVDGVVRRLDDLAERSGARIPAGRDDLADERLPRDDSHES